VKVSLKAIAIAAGVLWGGAILFLGLINLASPSFGLSFLQVVSSVYQGRSWEPGGCLSPSYNKAVAFCH
jgi:hypothetical protein